MRILTAALAALVLATPALAEHLKGAETPQRPVGHEVDQYRYGGTYSVRPSLSALSCERECAVEAVCEAWAFTSASRDNQPRCELKDMVGSLERRPGTTTGVSKKLFDRPGGPSAVRRYSEVSAQTPRSPAPEAASTLRSAETPAHAGAPLMLTEPTTPLSGRRSDDVRPTTAGIDILTAATRVTVNGAEIKVSSRTDTRLP